MIRSTDTISVNYEYFFEFETHYAWKRTFAGFTGSVDFHFVFLMGVQELFEELERQSV